MIEIKYIRNLKYKDTTFLNKKMEKKANLAVFLSDKIDLRGKSII